jgi:hypothetical protein
MTAETKTQHLTGEDKDLVDLVASTLIDPNLHTDLRMRLHEEVTEILHQTHEELYGTRPASVEHEPSEQSARLRDLLAAVLVDPNLHTDARMRLHEDLPELLESARRHTAERSEK